VVQKLNGNRNFSLLEYSRDLDATGSGYMHVGHLPKHYEPEKLEEEILRWWEENKIYEKAKKASEGGEKFYFLDRSKWLRIREDVGKRERLKIFGSDINAKYVEFARENSKEAFAEIDFFVEDALKIDYSNYDFVITDMPFGIRKKYENLEEIYKGFIDKVLDGDVKRFIILTAKWKLVEKFVEIKRKYYVDYGSLTAAILDVNI